MPRNATSFEQKVGQYMLFGQIGAGGMGTVHLGRRIGPAGFSRVVAIKRLHSHLLDEREFVNAFLDEARIAARVNHPNVVSIQDVVIDGSEVLLVMEYVHGRSLSQLTRVDDRQLRALPAPIAIAVATDILHGLHSAHEARDERGQALGLVHRDVSPQNVILGIDGVARVLDFGIAKALGRLHTTAEGVVKGKLAYMAPERLSDDGSCTPRVDIFSAGVVIWEMLSGERYLSGPADVTMIPKLAACVYRHLEDPALAKLDAVLERALHPDPNGRYATACDFAVALESAVDVASRVDVIAWVKGVAGAALAVSADAIAEIERSSVPPSLRDPTEGEATRTSSTSSKNKEPRPNPPTPDTHGLTHTLQSQTEKQRAPRLWTMALFLLGLAGVLTAGAIVRSRWRVNDDHAAPATMSPAADPSSAVTATSTAPASPSQMGGGDRMPGEPEAKPTATARGAGVHRKPPPISSAKGDAGSAPPAPKPDPEAPTDRK